MSTDPKRDPERDDNFRQALNQGMSRMPEASGESAWDQVIAGLHEAFDGATGFAAARIKDMGQDLVGRVLLGETSSPAPSDQHVEHAREVAKEQEPEPEID